MTLRLRVGRLLALLLIVIAQLGATPILASTTPTPTGTATASGTPAPSPGVSDTATSSITPTTAVNAPAASPTSTSDNITNSTALTATASPMATTAAATAMAVTDTAPIIASVPPSITTTVTPSTDILGDPAHAAHLKQQHPLHAALMTQSSKDPPPVSIVDPFNARLAVQVGANGRFNIGAFPDPATGGATATSWNLMYAWPGAPGTSFSTLRVDGADSIYGQDGTQVEAPTDIDARTNESAWRVGDILVTQTLQLVFNAQTGQDDVARIPYTATNTGSVAHDAGFRTMIDTMINNNDGAPFRVPGVGIVTHETDFTGDAVPDTFQAFFDLTDSTHVTASTLKSGGATVPDRLVLAAWPRIDGTAYDFTPDPSVDFSPSGYHDSAYAVYWNPAALAPGASRTFATLYGLAQENVDLQPPLALGVSGPAALSTTNGQYSPNPFNVVATIYDNGTAPATGVQLTLNLPTGLSLAGDAATQTVGDLAVGQERQVSWSVQAAPASSPTTLTYGVTASATNTSSKTVQRQISVPAGGQPASGLIPWHPHQSVRFAAGLGASVDLADGHVDVSAADMSIPGRGPQLTLNRTWDSNLAQRGVTTTAGEGWQSSLTPQLGGVLTATVSYTDDSGAAWDFIYSGDPSATGPYTTYTSPPGLPWQLTTSSQGYTLTNFLTGATRTFDPSGRLSATADSYGNNDAMVDDGTDQAGGALVDSGGRTIAYSYTNGLVGEEASPLWQSSGGTQGQHVTAAYNGVGQLTTQTLGAGTADAVTTTFGYSGTQLVTVTTGMGHQWLLGYDAQGRVAAITNTDTTPADVTQFSYNPDQTVAIEGFGQPHQRATIYALDGQGQATSVEDAVGDTITYTYDAQHDITSRADANNAPGHDTTTHYAYTYVGPNGNYGLLTTRTQPVIDASGPLVTRYAYDAHNNLTQVTSPKGNVTYYGYDDAHSVVTTTQELGPDGCVPTIRPAVTATPTPQPQVGTYRSFVKPYAVCVPGYAWRGRLNSYDAYGQLVATTDGRGLTVTGDPSSMPAVTVDPAQAVAHTQSYAYTAQGDFTQETTPPITTISHGVTATGSVITTIGYDDDGDPIATTSPNGNHVVSAYDHLGRLVGTTRRGVALAPVLPATIDITTGVGYDGDGNVITTTDGAGDLTRHDYDALGRVVKTTNPAGATTLYTYSGPVLTDGQDTTGQTTHYDYDGADRVTGVSDPLQARTTYGYDPVGNVTSITTPLDHGATVETRTYDALNHLATDTIAGAGEIAHTTPQVTTYTYDGDGNVVQGQAPNGDATYHFYDAADRLTGRALYPAPPATPDTVPPASSSEAFTYDPEGNLTDRIDYNERDHALTVDADNRLTRQVDSFANGPTAAPIATDLGYDPDGNVVSLTQQGGGVTATSAIVYNAAGWMLSQDDAAGQGVTYNAYDRAGRMVGQSLGVGLGGYTALGITAGQVNLYDREGRATRVYEGAQGATPQVTASNFTYTAADLPDTATLPGNVRETRGYDPDNRLGYLYAAGPAYPSLIAPATLSRRYVYGYDPQGHTTGITASIAGSNDTVDGGVWYINHDALGQMRTQTSPSYGYYTTTYDGNGNITGWKAQDARITVVRATYNYTPTAAQASAWLPNELVDARYDGLASEDLSFGYDQSGNTTSIADTTSSLGGATTATTALGYDAAGRVTTARLPDGTTVAMAYNARGLRSAVSVTKPNQTQPDYTETILYRGDQVGQVRVTGARPFAETFLYRQDGTPLELLYQATGRPLVRYWYEVDGQGSVVALTDSSGKQVSYYGYDRWGAPVQGTTARVEAVPQPLRYRGYWYDGWYHGADYNSDGTYNAAATSVDGFHTQDAPLPWYWLRVRYYDPFLERFLQPDPSAREGVRSYAYCHNDPVDCADPSGLAGVEPNPETGLMEAAGLEFRVGQTLDVNAESGAGESAVSSGPIAADAAAADVSVQLPLFDMDNLAGATGVEPIGQTTLRTHS